MARLFQMIVQVEAELGPADGNGIESVIVTTPSGYRFELPQKVFDRCFVELGEPMKREIVRAIEQLPGGKMLALALEGWDGNLRLPERAADSIREAFSLNEKNT